LSIALEQCAALGALEQRFAEAAGDCTLIRSLAEDMDQYRGNLRYLDIRRRLGTALEVCDRASALEEEIAAAGGDCAKARDLAATLTDKGDPRFAKAHAALAARLADCDRIERFAQRLEEAGQDCARLKALERDLRRETAPDLDPVRQRLRKALIPCRPKRKPPVIKPREVRPPTPVAKPPKGDGSFAMRGECSGRLVIEPSAGWDGDRVRHIVHIDPPASARVARVVSDNPGCRNCRLRRIGPHVWRGDLWFRCSGRGIVHVSYAAFDRQGRRICSGRGSDLCLGRR
jgi:hypothetical protein